MNLPTILLLAALLCAESPAGTPMERFLMAETVIYRSHVSGMSVEEVIHAPHQYAGVHTIDLEGYKLYRPEELKENIQIAMVALQLPPMRVSNFARTGTCNVNKPCEWESRCELIVIEGKHSFYVCPSWVKLESNLKIFKTRSKTLDKYLILWYTKITLNHYHSGGRNDAAKRPSLHQSN